MSKVKKCGAFSLTLLLVFGITVSTRAGNKDGEFWGEFWGNFVGEFIENIREADKTSTLQVRLQGLKYIYYTSADPGTYNETEVYFTLEMGKQERRMPDDEGRYWSIGVDEKIYPRDEYSKAPEATFSVPTFQNSYRVLIKTWDYDPVSDDDLLGWAIVKYDRYSSNVSIVKNSPNPRTAIDLDFALE